MPLGKVGSPQDTLTEVVVSSLKWMKLGALGAGTYRGQTSKNAGEIVNKLGMRKVSGRFSTDKSYRQTT